jgi:tetratricopeptide (TPR) repeat protein
MLNDELKALMSKRIDEIRSLYDRKLYDLALEKNDEFISDYPSAWIGYREKADILEASGRFDEALSIRKHLVELSSEEPCDFYDFVRLSVNLGEYGYAIVIADKGIVLCEDNSEYYYYQALHFYKAYALVKSHKYKEAIQSCLKLEGDYGTYISGVGMVKRGEILDEARVEIKKRDKRKKVWKFE